MSNKEISFLIMLMIFVLAVILEHNTSNDVANINCQNIVMSNFSCIVINKEKEVTNHCQLKIYCKDLLKDSLFIVYPDVIIPYDSLFYFIEIGDTLLKYKNENYFLIINNKIDTFKFQCNQ